MRRVLFFAAISSLFSVPAFCAPYLGKEFEFHQPDGSSIAVRVWGDEFYIRAETLDGYSLVHDPVSGFICYAKVNDEGSDFISTGIPYTGQTVEKLKYSGLWPLAQGNGIKKGLRLKHQAVIEKADRNRRLLGRDQRGRILPAPDSGTFPAASAQADSPAPLIGQIVGLTLLIQFPDVPATISQADIDNYCNQVGYTGYGNNGSVRDYFYDVSNGNLTYTNYVTVYYTALYNRSYYTDPNISYGTRARELIKEALLWLDDPSGQNFNFGTISTNAGNYMLAINAFYAGSIQNAWAKGLWPHMSSMYGMFTSNEGVKAGVYQITNIGSSLALGTFCHENGHMICSYPDLYDYGYESYGAGNYCLMAYGGSDYNPIPPNPYLRDIKSWESVTVFPHLSGVQYFLQSNSNTSYKYLNPDNSKEFFYIDSRTKTGRNSSLPDDGLAIWHIDENGDNDNEQMTPSQHYLVSVEQADGLFHLEHGNNAGGSGDLFHAGYKDIFNDTTIPDAKWWNGANSNLVIRQISAVGSTMSFVYDDSIVPHPPVAQTGSAGTQINTPVTITLVATDEGLPNPPGALTYIITSLPSYGTLSDPANGIISNVPYSLLSYGNQVIYTPNTNSTVSDSFQFKANDGGTAPDGGDSNIATVSISVVDAIYMANMDTNPGWTLDSLWQWGTPTGSGGQYGNHDPTAGYTGTNVVGYNLLGDYENSITSTRWAKTPAINCSNRTNVTLTFYRWLNVEQPLFDHAYIQVSNSGSSWSTIWQNSSVITDSSWTLQTFDISAIADNQPTVYIRWGMGTTDSSWQYSGWNIDDVKVTGIIAQLRTLTISSTDGGFTEPNEGSHQYANGTVVDINAIPDSHYHFVNWTGTGVTAGKVANPNAASTTITMDGDYTVDANFASIDAPVLNAEPNITPGLCNTISWDVVSEANDYYAECSSDPCFLVVDYNSGWITRTSYQFCGLTSCQEYWYRVKSGLSAWSQASQAEFQSDTLIDTTATSGGDVILVTTGTDVVGGTAYPIDTDIDSYFNGFLVTTETTLTQIEIYLGISTSRSIEFVVYEGGTLFTDPYNRIHLTTLASSGTGTKFYSSGSVSILLKAGIHYMIGAVWNGPVTAYYDEIDISPTFADHTGWGYYYGFPSPDILSEIFNDPFTFYHRYTTTQATGYTSSGSIVSVPINLPAGGSWNVVDFNTTTPPNTGLTVDILPATGSTPITGYENVPSGADLGGISEPAIRLRANLSTNDPNSTPALHDWSVTYTDPAGIESDWSSIESSIQIILGDFEPDCDVDLDDLAVLVNQWLQPPGTPSADIAPQPNGDGIVNFLDFALMAENWMK